MKPSTLLLASEHAVAEFPKESCGLIIAIGRKEVYVPCKNIATTPSEHFIMDPQDYADAEDRGKIIGVVHSHPQAAPHPSEADKVSCENTAVTWHILAVHTDPATPDDPPKVVAVESFNPSGYEAPLVGREFAFGIQDCYTIIQDWYKRVRDEILPDFERTDKFWERGEDLYVDNLEKGGFTQVKGALEVGDLILMNIRSDIINHAAIYIGDGMILQHMYGHLSTRDPYGGYWQENTRMVVRRVPE